MSPTLSFEQAPPISVPFRFLLSAPWFGATAGLLLLIEGPSLLSSRWMPTTLAVTHLLVVGFMLQAMAGALLQFVPVAAGGNVWRPRLVAGIAYPLLVIAAILLVLAFLKQVPGLFIAAAHSFIVGLLLLGGTIAIALWRTPATGTTVVALRMALLGLGVTLALGATLALGLAKGWSLPFPLLTDIHAVWGLGGWSLMLLLGVSYYVVPMFQLTPPYPPALAKTLPWLLLTMLVIWSMLPGSSSTLRTAVMIGGLGTAAAYAGVTLWLQSRRRRKVVDSTLRFFQLAMISLIGVLFSVLVFLIWPTIGEQPSAIVWLGVLVLIGVFMSAISGMLYKIVPFLCWLHLQRLGSELASGGLMPPTMNDMISARAIRYQLLIHTLALVIVAIAVWWPVLSRAAGLLLLISCSWLGINLLTAALAYRRFRDRIRAGA